jgi:hypothetical protein
MSMKLTAIASLAAVHACVAFVPAPLRLQGIQASVLARTAGLDAQRTNTAAARPAKSALHMAAEAGVQIESPFAAPGKGFGSGGEDDDDGPLPLTLENVELVSAASAHLSAVCVLLYTQLMSKRN